MTYKVVRNAQGDVVAFGPDDNNYEPHIKAGEVLAIENTAPVLPVAVPRSITRHQAMVVIRKAGKKAALITFLSAAGREDSKDAFESRATFDRDSQLIADIKAAGGFTDAQIDKLFIDGSKIN